jgi:O-Antigen ligase.
MIWAIDASLALKKANTLIQIFIMTILVFSFFYNTQNLEFFIKSLCIAGIVMCLYIIFYYGIINYFIQLMSGTRIGTEISNVNDIAIYAGFTALICFYYAIYFKKKYYYFITILPVLISLGTESRKALIIIFCGILLLIMFKLGSGKKIKVLLAISIFIMIFMFFIQLPIFNNYNERFQGLINFITGNGVVDHSMFVREQMISVGWEQFKISPLIGIGMDNSRFIAIAGVGTDTYLHNNYIELLVDGGIFAFIIYYAAFAYVLIKLIPLIKNKNHIAIITFTILILQVLLDYGAVSYYSKITYIYLILGFLVANIEKKNQHIREDNCNVL